MGRVREAKPGLLVILMTAYSCENLAIQALRAGVTDYLKKPLTFSDLRGRLSAILEGKNQGDGPESVESREVFIMDCIAAFMEENYIHELTLDKVAARGGMNRFRFCRGFKERFGMNYTSYLNNIRTRNAARLIKNSDMKITEISHLVGYNCVTYFERVFKARYGVPPTEYRREGRTDKDKSRTEKGMGLIKA
ncbi:MAG: helix-turn-helix domain-containing protein [Nitrospirae bacterium]|nr:helix-turn-helix domain-containing protein [Nitrospirota bacterium]MCL5422384.1 helix-turn-helix domain-containing protein [Nitrospirota bacterium]